MGYVPGEIPNTTDVEQVRLWLVDELRQISKNFNETQELELRERNVEPNRPRKGMIVYADGSDWDPGEGEGIYYFNGTNWQKLEAASSGTWTPVVKGLTTPGTQTYTTQLGFWARYGDMVTVQGHIILSAKDAATAGILAIGGLPFTSRASITQSFYFGSYALVNLGAGYSQLSGVVSAASTDIVLIQTGDNIVNATLLAADFAATTSMFFAGSYLAA